MFPRKHISKASQDKPAKPAHLHRASDAADAHGNGCDHLQVFDYVTSSHGDGVVIHLLPQKVGVILDATSEVVYFERLEDIERIQPLTFFSALCSSGEEHDRASQEDEYQYLDPYGWPYNDPAMTDEYLVACGFPTREAAGYPFPTKPEHVERIRGARLVSTPLGKGKLWRNWDTQVGVILEGTQRVTFFSKPEEWALIVPLDMVSLSDEERQIKNATHQE